MHGSLNDEPQQQRTNIFRLFQREKATAILTLNEDTNDTITASPRAKTRATATAKATDAATTTTAAILLLQL